MASLREYLERQLRARGARQASAPLPRSKPAPFRPGKVIRQPQGQTEFL